MRKLLKAQKRRISEAPTTDLTVTVVVGHKTSEDGDVTPVTRSVVIGAGTTSTDLCVHCRRHHLDRLYRGDLG
ncbi:hypothetical protein [Enterovibrio norvegicus]|uniref:hypothetical protein n=1 Tax=Enterovibrio norvegicus TaxID=188144 RepID=UPI0010426B42|nr:hypothetical protein [Enterovibrio norvegicus]